MEKLQPVRGTHDLFGDDKRLHDRITECARTVAGSYGYEPVATPVLEFADVFQRTLGDASDIVTKEMYTFESGSGETITLRPEGTAPVARALVSGGRLQALPVRIFYEGPMFRRERPQKGRMRQFHQVGIELVGEGDPLGDVEVMVAGHRLLVALGLEDAVSLRVHTLGGGDARDRYREALREYLSGREKELSEDSCRRLARNPLRILDSKNPDDQAVVRDAPRLLDFLDGDSRGFFDSVLAGLDASGIPHEVDPLLVRGLDYYCHTTFEFVTDRLGAQGAVIAGGRYDGLTEFMGGAAVPGVGWAAGVERLALLSDGAPPQARLVCIIPVNEETKTATFALAEKLRDGGVGCELAIAGGLRRGLKRADRLGARAAVLLGADEMKEGRALVRDMDSGEQTSVPLGEIADFLASSGNGDG